MMFWKIVGNIGKLWAGVIFFLLSAHSSICHLSDGLSYFLGKIPSFLNQNSTLHITSDYLVPLQILANTHLESNEMYKNAKILG